MKIALKLNLLTFILTSLAVVCRAQLPVWRGANHWTLYNLRGAKFYKVPLDSLDSYNSGHLNDDSMRTFISRATVMPSAKAPMWMGAFVTTCMINHKKRKVDISSYGGFFYDEIDKKYYSVPQEIQKEWLNYLAESAGAIPSQK